MLGTAVSAIAIAPAHAQVSDASLRGTITLGEGVTAQQVTAVEVATNYRRNAEISADGSYNFPSLRPGTYRLEIQTDSGVRTTDEFTLLVGQAASLDFDLATEQVSDSDDGAIVVVANRIRSMQGGEVGVNITQRQIEQLPQNNRNFLAFAELAPGVQFLTTSAEGYTQLRAGAQGASAVNVYIDGVGQKDYVLPNGVTGQDSTQGNPFPQLAVGEYRVITSNYKAEFDQVSSAAITAVTKSGTNKFHGEAFIDFTNQSLREKRPQEIQDNSEKTKTRDLQFGGALGGPIIKDVMHFFATYEGKRQQIPVEITPGLSRDVSSFPTQYQGYFGSATREFRENLYFGKIDFEPTDSDLFELSLKYRDESGIYLNNGTSAQERATYQDTKDWRGLARWQHSGSTWINDLKLAYENAHWSPQPTVFETGKIFNYAGPDSNNTPGVVQRGTLLQIGGSANYQDKGQEGWTVSDDFTYTGLDRHTFKAGVKAKWVTLNALSQNNFNPQYTYNTGYNPNGGTFNDQIPYQLSFFVSQGAIDVESKNFQLGAYVQDDWEVTDRLTLVLGVRWDYERTPSFLNFVTPADVVDALSPAKYPNLNGANFNINDYISDGNSRKAFKGAWQPRLGFNYKLDDAGRFVVFGGYGRSYDRNAFDYVRQEVSTLASSTRTFSFITGDPNNTCSPSVTCVAWDPVYLTEQGRAQLVANAGLGGGRELHLINNDLKMPYSDQFSLGTRGQFGLVNLEVGYMHVASHDGFGFLYGDRRADGSFFPAAPAAPSTPFNINPPGFGALLIGTNGIETRLNSGYFKFGKNYSSASPWSLNATYTYTAAKENQTNGNYFSFDFPSFDDYPMVTSTAAPKHRIVAAGSVDVPLGLTLSTKVVMASPPILRSLVSVGGATPSRTVTTAEAFGNGDRWGYRQVDLAITKYVPLTFFTDESRIRLRVDILNLFNDRNYVNYNSNPTDSVRTSPSDTIYRERTGYGVGGNAPRTIKLSAGFSF